MYHSMWTYLWDLCEDGIDDSVRYLKNEVGIDGERVALAYHTYQQLRPQRSGRKLLTCDTAALYYRPDQKLYADTARGCGVEQLAFSNYGIMPKPNLDRVRQCIRG